MFTRACFRRLNSTISSHRQCTLKELPQKGIYLMTLDRPLQKNSLGKLMMDEFRSNLDYLRNNSKCRVLIINSNCDGVFCAGADLKERAKMTPDEVSLFVHGLRTAFTDFQDLPMPTIAAIDGFALGGGFELALSADLRVAGNTARMGFPETNLAIIPGAGGTQRLPRLIGLSLAKELIFTGRILNAPEALDMKLINRYVEGPSLPSAITFAETMLNKGPIALQMAKLAINHGTQLDLSNGLTFEKACYAQIIPTQDRLEGLAAFKEKRKPIYKGL